MCLKEIRNALTKSQYHEMLQKRNVRESSFLYNSFWWIIAIIIVLPLGLLYGMVKSVKRLGMKIARVE